METEVILRLALELMAEAVIAEDFFAEDYDPDIYMKNVEDTVTRFIKEAEDTLK